MNLETLHDTLSAQLNTLPVGGTLFTPDRQRARRFTIHHYQDEVLTIETQGRSRIRLPIEAFLNTLIHMHDSGSCAAVPSLIRSSNLEPPEGGLCAIARGTVGQTRMINYVLPVLESLGWVQTDGDRRPNVAWLNSSGTGTDH